MIAQVRRFKAVLALGEKRIPNFTVKALTPKQAIKKIKSKYGRNVIGTIKDVVTREMFYIR